VIRRWAGPGPLAPALRLAQSAHHRVEWLRALAAAPFVAGALLFALLAALFGYWRCYLPGGRYLGRVAPEWRSAAYGGLVAAFGAANALRLSIATEAKSEELTAIEAQH